MPVQLPDRAARLPRKNAEAADQWAGVAIAVASLLLLTGTLLAVGVDGGTGAASAQMQHGEYSPFEISRTAGLW